MSRVAVLGGGISGLSAAFYLSQAATSRFNQILLLESSGRVGGWVQTNVLPDGSVFEAGPRSVRGVGQAGHNTLELAEQLALSGEVVPVHRTHPAARNRFLYVDGQLCPLPAGMSALYIMDMAYDMGSRIKLKGTGIGPFYFQCR